MSSSAGGASIVKASKNLDEMRDIAARICRDYLTGAWKVITADEIQLKRISGGLSNFLYYVALPDNVDNNNDQQQRTHCKRLRKDVSRHLTSEPKEVLLRIYGQMHGEQAMETVLTDTVVFTLLSERKLGPKLHGIFPGGRIEQYIPARPLTTHELSDSRISAKIAEKMAAIHSLNIPVSKEPEWLWKTMARWLQSSEKVLAQYETVNTHETDLCEDMRSFDFRGELAWLKQTIDAEDYAVVFSHNDLQEGNILFRETAPMTASGAAMTTTNGASNGTMERIPMAQFDDEDVSNTATTAVDDENAGNLDRLTTAGADATINGCDDVMMASRTAHSKRTFSLNADDIDPDNTRDSVLSDGSQIFCCDAPVDDGPALMIIDFEYCAYNYRGFDVANHMVEWTMDYTNKAFPFYHHRIGQYPSREQQEHFVTAYLRSMVVANGGPEDYQPSAKEIGELLDEVRCFRMASHLFWTLWAIVNVHQDIEFGYWDYGMCRLKEYISAKEEYSKAKGLSLKRKHTLDKRQ